MPGSNETDRYVRPAAQDGDEIDLRAYWRVIVRRRWVILGVFAGDGARPPEHDDRDEVLGDYSWL